MASRMLIKETLSILNLLGLDPLKEDKWGTCKKNATLIWFAIFYVELIIDMIMNWTGWRVLIDMLPFVLVIQTYMHRLLRLAFCNKGFVDVFKLMDSLKVLTNDVQHFSKLKKKTNKKLTVIKRYLTFLYIAMVVNYIATIVYNYMQVEKSCPLPFYHWVSASPYYELMHIFLGVSSLIVDLCFTVPHEILFFAFVFNLIYEIKIVQIALANIKITERTVYEDLKPLIDNHNVIFKCIKTMNNIYSQVLLHQFLCSSFCICATSIAIIAAGFPPDWNTFPLVFATLLYSVAPLYIYCKGGTSLDTEWESVAQAAYNSEWWHKTQPKFRRSLVLIMQNANKPVRITAGGFFPLNYQTFTRILNSALSFFSVARAAYK